jgi:hypothetical protein
LGSAWGLAVRDPKWQIQAIAAHVPVHRALAPLRPLVRTIGRRATPYVAATMIGVERAIPAATRIGGSSPAIVQTVGQQAVAAEVRQVATQPAVRAIVNDTAQAVAQPVARASAPAAAGLTQAASPLAQEVTSGAVRAVQVAGASESRRAIDPDIDEAVERSFVEHAGPATAAQTRRPGAVARHVDATAARQLFGNVRDAFAQILQVAAYGQVHHAIEVQVLSRYPGVYTVGEINQFQNMRGIPPEVGRRTQLHNSKIREILDRHYAALDDEIARRGLQPGTPEYNQLVRTWVENARDEIDWALGQFFSEQRATFFAPNQ